MGAEQKYTCKKRHTKQSANAVRVFTVENVADKGKPSVVKLPPEDLYLLSPSFLCEPKASLSRVSLLIPLLTEEQRSGS